jgi:ribonuclease P protein component
MPNRFTLGKNERLKSRKQIEQLFKEGKTFASSFYFTYYLFSPSSNEDLSFIQFGVGVSGKNFKKAVDRNRIKRLTKEAYRLQKSELQKKLKEKKIKLNIFFIYTANELPDFNKVKENIAVILNRIDETD